TPVGELGGVDDLHVVGQHVEELLGGEPVGDDDFGLAQQLEAAQGDQVGVAGSGADEGHAGAGPRAAGARGVDLARAQPLGDGVADGGGAPRVSGGGDGD